MLGCCWAADCADSDGDEWMCPRAGRLARIRVAARDAPGALARITAAVASAGANIEEVHHQRAFSHLSVQNVEVELVLQTRHRAHVAEVMAALAAQGFEVSVPD